MSTSGQEMLDNTLKIQLCENLELLEFIENWMLWPSFLRIEFLRLLIYLRKIVTGFADTIS
jgi:hypothetical protein